MYPFWNKVIEPLVRASGAERLVEIGALRGENTKLMVDALGPDAELHVIDPVPAFDPDEQAREFPGQYVFHRDLSLNVLPTAPPFDVALVDGDHNWYTVYNELRLLAATAREHDRHLPLLLLHDVGWPYGRRDLYYAPEQIPEEFRQPHQKKGMRPGRRELLPGGGMNITLDNAEVEGGARNGVMTALDDFMAEHDRPLRLVVLPIYFGLAIVAEEAMLAERPAVAALLDELESPSGLSELLELSEEIRLDGVVFEHNIDRIRNDQAREAAKRYLDLLASTLDDSTGAVSTAREAWETVDGSAANDGAVVTLGLADRGAATFLRGCLAAHHRDTTPFWAIEGDTPSRAAMRADFERLGLTNGQNHVVAPGGTDELADTPISILHAPADIGPTLAELFDRLQAQVLPGGVSVRGDSIRSH